MKSLLFVCHNSGHKKGHQRQSFNTRNFVSITKATCYALQLNHNKEAMRVATPGLANGCGVLLSDCQLYFKHSVLWAPSGAILTSSLHPVVLVGGFPLRGLTACFLKGAEDNILHFSFSLPKSPASLPISSQPLSMLWTGFEE